jgi:hypothetical protein
VGTGGRRSCSATPIASCGSKPFGQVCAKCVWQVHAYCLMTKHFHLVVENAVGEFGGRDEMVSRHVYRALFPAYLQSPVRRCGLASNRSAPGEHGLAEDMRTARLEFRQRMQPQRQPSNQANRSDALMRPGWRLGGKRLFPGCSIKWRGAPRKITGRASEAQCWKRRWSGETKLSAGSVPFRWKVSCISTGEARRASQAPH